MPIVIEGAMYHAASEVTREIGISRQTLWRWRSEGRIPQGRRFRDRQVVFSNDELQEIRGYANHLEPASLQVAEQMALFGAPKGPK